jgi:hypothetical protein
MRLFMILIIAVLAAPNAAEARRAAAGLHPDCNIRFPCEVAAHQKPARTAQDAPTQRRGQYAARQAEPRQTAALWAPAAGLSGMVSRPGRFIAGRLTCALNVGAALAERGIRGTGSALAHSYDRWGVRAPGPVPGAVAVTDRRGGGHVAIVSRVEGGRVFAFNPGRRGWREVEYTHRRARYRLPG